MGLSIMNFPKNEPLEPPPFLRKPPDTSRFGITVHKITFMASFTGEYSM